jgi:GTP-binding protein HflX
MAQEDNSLVLPRAVVVGVQLPGITDEAFESSLRELERLGKTLGLEIAGRVTQRLPHLDSAAVLGSGKLRELGALTGGVGVVEKTVHRKAQKKDGPAEFEPEVSATLAEDTGQGAEVVLIDHDLSPTQVRNLERATGAQVLDRTSVILNIFQRHAHSRAAKLQVEIARLNYDAPRLRESSGGKDRQRGGIGGRGAGESALELDRRKVRDRIAELREELASIERDAGTRRARRAEQNTVALVGYTNAGKSSLMRGLTGRDVYVADKLFATLDTTVRSLKPETNPRILVSDTVGFIKKLPHDLVASFRSTLDEASEAHLLLHVVDGADPAFREQLEVTRTVLEELGADQPRWLLLNKVDLLDDAARQALKEEFPEAIQLSSRVPEDVAALRERFVAFFASQGTEAVLFVPYEKQRLIALLHEATNVLDERHDELGTHIRVRGPAEVLTKIERELAVG